VACGSVLGGATTLGWSLVLVVIALSGLLAATGLCVGCEMYGLGSASAVAAAWETGHDRRARPGRAVLALTGSRGCCGTARGRAGQRRRG
jgi:hypothetical protein